MTDLRDDSQKEKRVEMIRQALREKAPILYEDLESSGRLQIFLEGHDAEIMARYEEAKNAAWEETWNTLLNFADDSYNESTSPMG